MAVVALRFNFSACPLSSTSACIQRSTSLTTTTVAQARRIGVTQERSVFPFSPSSLVPSMPTTA
jgi:hypothetical protein